MLHKLIKIFNDTVLNFNFAQERALNNVTRHLPYNCLVEKKMQMISKMWISQLSVRLSKGYVHVLLFGAEVSTTP